MPKSKSPMELAIHMLEKIDEEENGPYKVIFDELKRLDEQYPKVNENHQRADLGLESIDFAYANLLFSSHAAYCYPEPPLFTRKEALTTLRLMCNIPNGRMTVTTLLYDLFPQAVVCVEHLYFLQRQVRRIFALPDSERPELLRGAKVEEWTYPDDLIDQLRVKSIDLWKDVEDKKYADETRQ